MHSMRLNLQVLLLLALFAGLVGCGSDDDDDEPEMTTFAVTLSGHQSVPRYNSEHTAIADIKINEDSMAMTVTMDLSTVDGVTAAHIHDGEIGTNGAVIFPFTELSPNVWGIKEEVLKAPEYDRLLAGDWYINVHTTEKADGEIRGQIIPENMTLFTFAIEPDQEVPRVDSNASGSGYGLYDDADDSLMISVITGELTANMVHLHTAAAGLEGEPLVSLEQDVTNTQLWQTPHGLTITADSLAALNTAGLYINVHTEAYPDGEIRGQILPEDYSLFVFPLNGAQQVPPVLTLAQGMGYASVNTESGKLQLNVQVSELAAQAAHIHAGLPGMNGDVVITLTENGETPGLWQTPANTLLDSAALTTLLNGGHYVNFHTADHPAGEIRGQVSPALLVTP